MADNLSYENRIQIQTMHDNKRKVADIAKYVGCHRSTIYRELNRAKHNFGVYTHDFAHKNMQRSMTRLNRCGPTIAMINLIESKLVCEQWSPEQISNWMKKHNHGRVSHVWIYQHIARDKEAGGELANHLRRGPYSKEPREYRGHIKNRHSIETRPIIINDRIRLGDYEIDLIVGPKNKGAMLSVIDRVSRHTILEKLNSKSATEVAQAVIRALKPYRNLALTITSDNGTEFTQHEAIAEMLNIDYFFAHPYASYERGTVENLNGLVRQYIPKGTDFDTVSPEMVKQIEHKLNNRPRKILNFWTPNEFLEHNNVKRSA